MLGVEVHSYPRIRYCGRRPSSRRLAAVCAALAASAWLEGRPWRRTTNSSPPRRPTVWTRRHVREQAKGDLLEETVAEPVAEGVIEVFEVIEIEEEQGAEGVIFAGDREGFFEAAVNHGAIGKAGEPVRECQAFCDDCLCAESFAPFALDDVRLPVARDHGEHGCVEKVAELHAEDDDQLSPGVMLQHDRKQAEQDGRGCARDEEAEVADGAVEVDEPVEDEEREEPDEEDQEVELAGFTARAENDAGGEVKGKVGDARDRSEGGLGGVEKRQGEQKRFHCQTRDDEPCFGTAHGSQANLDAACSGTEHGEEERYQDAVAGEYARPDFRCGLVGGKKLCLHKALGHVPELTRVTLSVSTSFSETLGESQQIATDVVGGCATVYGSESRFASH